MAEPSHRTLVAFSSRNIVPSERWLLLAKMGKLVTSLGLRVDVDPSASHQNDLCSRRPIARSSRSILEMTLGECWTLSPPLLPHMFPGFRNLAYPPFLPSSRGFAIYLFDLQLVDIHVLECPDLG